MSLRNEAVYGIDRFPPYVLEYFISRNVDYPEERSGKIVNWLVFTFIISVAIDAIGT